MTNPFTSLLDRWAICRISKVRVTFPSVPTERNIGYTVPFHFTPAQRAFLARHDISCSDGYIGMLRAYCGNRTVWQTSASAPILGAMVQGSGGPKVDWDALNRENLTQLHAWVNDLMALTDAEVADRLAAKSS